MQVNEIVSIIIDCFNAYYQSFKSLPARDKSLWVAAQSPSPSSFPVFEFQHSPHLKIKIRRHSLLFCHVRAFEGQMIVTMKCRRAHTKFKQSNYSRRHLPRSTRPASRALKNYKLPPPDGAAFTSRQSTACLAWRVHTRVWKFVSPVGESTRINLSYLGQQCECLRCLIMLVMLFESSDVNCRERLTIKTIIAR